MCPGERSMSALGWRKKTKSRSPSAVSDTKVRPVRTLRSKPSWLISTPSAARVSARKWPNGSSPTRPMNPDDAPRRANPMATLAGAPPAAFSKAGAWRKVTPVWVETKSSSASPMVNTSGIDASFLILAGWFPTLVLFQPTLNQGVFVGQGDNLAIQPGGAQMVQNLAVERARAQVELVPQIMPVNDRFHTTQLALELGQLCAGSFVLTSQPSDQDGF